MTQLAFACYMSSAETVIAAPFIYSWLRCFALRGAPARRCLFSAWPSRRWVVRKLLTAVQRADISCTLALSPCLFRHAMSRFGRQQYWWLFVATTVCLHVFGLCLAENREERNLDSTGSIVDVNKLSKVLSDIAYAGKTVKDALSKAWQSVSKLKIFQRKHKKVLEPIVPAEP
ncbi:uncharacterized protein LOC119466133 isoform X2 [Dermacentor silvarum]|uniref:uncharacterized protein LOC119466133 isoform X2 n=1 Tax=Dermacentor silvarum TaxID=543639 RepID=UPI0021010AA0|nr:uncharacterized protein LOC119466133 isoform X2 [Dermacentor silvarum]